VFIFVKEKDCKHISMEGSEVLSWDDIDEYRKKHGFVSTSAFIQYLTEKHILGIKKKFDQYLAYIMYLIIIVLILLLMLIK